MKKKVLRIFLKVLKCLLHGFRSALCCWKTNKSSKRTVKRQSIKIYDCEEDIHYDPDQVIGKGTGDDSTQFIRKEE